jgi:hypothetical protein
VRDFLFGKPIPKAEKDDSEVRRLIEQIAQREREAELQRLYKQMGVNKQKRQTLANERKVVNSKVINSYGIKKEGPKQ